MPSAARRYDVEHPNNESSTDISPTETRASPWTTDVFSDYLSFNPNKEDINSISVVGWNNTSTSHGSHRSKEAEHNRMTESDKKHYQISGCLFALIVVSIIIAIGTTVALIIVLTQDVPESELSTTPAPVPYRVVTYNGQFSLEDQWDPSLDNTSSSEYAAKVAQITQQLDKAFMHSVLWRYYNHSAVTSLRKGSIFSTFDLIFSTLREYTPVDETQPVNISFSPNLIGAVILEQFLDGVLNLPLNRTSVVIKEIVTTTTSTVTDAPSTPLPDLCYQLEFSTCQHLYNVTALPSQNQTAAEIKFTAFYTQILRSSCSENALALFCGSTFTRCDPETGKLIYPCKHLCEEVSSSCSLQLPCLELPDTSEGCYDGGLNVNTTTAAVTTPSTTRPLPGTCHSLSLPACQVFYDYTAMPVLNQTEGTARFDLFYSNIIDSNCSQNALAFFCSQTFSKCDASTGAEIPPCQHLCQEVASACLLNLPCSTLPHYPEACFDGGLPIPSTTIMPLPGTCHSLSLPACQVFYDYTAMPVLNQTEGTARFDLFYSNIIDSNCSQNALAFFCSQTFSKCDASTGAEVPPCQHLCQEVASACLLNLPCSNHPHYPEACFDGGLPIPSTTIMPLPDSCHPIEVSTCRDLYSYTTLPSSNQTEEAVKFDLFYGDILQSNCSQNAKAFFCGWTFSQCDSVSGGAIRPCLHLCEEVAASCALELPCSQLPQYPDACYSGGLELPTTTTTAPDVCEKLVFKTCQPLFNYTEKNPDQSQTDRISFFNGAYQPIIDRQCSTKTLELFCYLQFPQCEPSTRQTIGPCRKLCEEVSADCRLLLACSRLPDNDCYYDGLVIPPVLSTSVSPVTTFNPGLCTTVKVPECIAHYRTTVLFEGWNETALIERFNNYTELLNSGCSTVASLFLCVNTFPRCQPMFGLAQFPCQDLCTAFVQGCGSSFNIRFDCSKYPVGGDCVGLQTISTSTSTTVTPDSTTDKSTQPPIKTCEKINSLECGVLLPYSMTSFPNEFGHTSMESANQRLEQLLIDQSGCSFTVLQKKLLLCPLLFPRCDQGRKIPVCRAVCESLPQACVLRTSMSMSCDNYPNDDEPTICETSGVVDSWSPSSPPPCEGFQCSNEMCLLDTAKVCDGINDCGDYTDELFCGEESVADCNFEQGTMCGYDQHSNSLFDWSIHNGSTPSAFTGPHTDNTYKNETGHFIYLEATGVSEGRLSQLTFPESSWLQHCYRISYHMRGHGMGSLKILTREAVSNKTSLHWAVSGNLGKKWQTAEVFLPQGDYSIIIEGVRGSLYTSDIAIDDITSRQGKCPSLPTHCQSDEFTCNSTGLCLPASKRCDTINDCGDYSDEQGCDCSDRQYYFQCNYGNCIKAYKQCDNNTDCPDGSDEVNCVCPNGQVQCPDGKCIMSEWLCDGDWDCQNGWDEDNCLRCEAGEHTCQDYSCVKEVNVCDGEFHCADHSDENYCVRRRSWDNMLEIKHGLAWLPVCSASFDVTLGNKICEMTGDGAYNGTVRLNYASTSYLHYDKLNGGLHWLKNIRKSNSCEDAAVMGIKCQKRGCGTQHLRKVSAYITGGQNSRGGKWPWMASLTNQGLHECGGTLIAPQFVLTAAHCIRQFVNDPSSLKIVLGGTSWGSSQPNRKEYPVKKVIPHPEFSIFLGYDIGLVQLKSSVEYDPYISPVCLPEPEELFPTSSLCFVAGWGQTYAGSGVSRLLKEAKIKLWQNSKCNSSLSWNGSISHTDFCAGYVSGSIGTCHGDSGGPLMCYDQTKRWTLVGISSYVISDCKLPGFPPVFTDVKKQLDWIQSHIECKFRCDNGQCLYDNQLICNREDDCGDNSDETRNCLSTLNCTFDDPFHCGYTYNSWFSSSGIQRQAPYPSHDHTVGTSPGMYMASNVKGTLSSPRVTLPVAHCVRFFFNYGTSTAPEFSVAVDFFASDGGVVRKQVFRASNRSDTEIWQMGQFELPIGTSQVIFEGQVVAVDDVLALPGTCENQGCLEGEFNCALSGCIKDTTVCNLAVDCLLRPDDELTCSEHKSYNCTFENNLDCGITRPYDFRGNQWTLQNGTTNKQVKKDHTLSTAEGQFLYSPAGETSMFGTLFLLPRPPYCLQFVYQIYSKTAELEVEGAWTLPTENRQHLLRVSGQRNLTWNQAIIPMPSAPFMRLTFTFSAPYQEQNDATFAAVDDIVVTSGECPTLNCPAGYVKCSQENFCITPSQKCDRKIDCTDLSDENNCNCTESEFKCGNGLCISSSLICNGVPDCLDQTDELAVCDELRSVACDFEDDFICGYTIVQSSRFSWIRNSGPTVSRNTGPSADHTFDNFTGHYLYTEASFGKPGDITELTSPLFTVSVQDNIQFYYHMRGKDIGELVVLSSVNGSSAKRIWDKSGDQGNQWNFACLPLPSGANSGVTFMATYDGSYGDIAIDDISLISQPCPEMTTPTSGLSPTAAPNACPPGQRACSNGMCLNSVLFCNQFMDCNDGSDESNCPAA